MFKFTKKSHFTTFKKQKGFEKMVCGQAVLPDMPILIGQKWVKNAKIEKLKWDIFGDFQTMWRNEKIIY